MIKCHLSRLMGERKLTISDVSVQANLNRNTVSKLYNEKVKRVDLETIERLCRLFECEVGDLLEIVE